MTTCTTNVKYVAAIRDWFCDRKKLCMLLCSCQYVDLSAVLRRPLTASNLSVLATLLLTRHPSLAPWCLTAPSR